MGRRKITFWERIGYFLEYILVVPLSWLIRLIPRFMEPAVARFLGWIFYHINTRDKKWAYFNLDVIFADDPLNWEEKDKIVRRLYRNIVRFGIEYVKMGRITAKNYLKYAYYENYANSVLKSYSMGKGIIVITLHLGNWEYMGSVSAKLGLDLAVVINRQFNPYTDRWLRRIREKKGKIKCFYNEITEAKNLAKHLRRGGAIALVADQTYYFKPIFVPFFGRPSATADGPAKLHLKFGSPIIMCYCARQPDGRYLFKFEDPVIFEPTNDPLADSKKIMAWVNSRYEEYIRAYPDQYFSLLHARWERSTPEEFQKLDFDPF